MAVQDPIKLLQWNCRSLLSNLSQFKIFLYTHKPHVACLCETWLSPSRTPSFINYVALYSHRPGPQPGGGLAFLVRSDVSHVPFPLNPFPQGSLECACISLYLADSSVINVINVYNPNRSVAIAEFDHYCDQLGNTRILVGDFNAHHPMWSPNQQPNVTGNNLFSVLFNDPTLHLLTAPSSPTYYNTYHNTFSTLDLTIVSSNLAPLSHQWIESDLGSDHYPILTSIGKTPLSCTTQNQTTLDLLA